MANKEGMLILFSGPSGVGKDAVLDIVLNKGTMMNGVFSLYRKVKPNIHFKGANTRTYYNPQYNIVANPNYFTEPQEVEGKNLCLLAK